MRLCCPRLFFSSLLHQRFPKRLSISLVAHWSLALANPKWLGEVRCCLPHTYILVTPMTWPMWDLMHSQNRLPYLDPNALVRGPTLIVGPCAPGPSTPPESFVGSDTTYHGCLPTQNA